MIIDVLTLFPEMFTGVLSSSIIKRAIDKEIVKINIYDFRTFSKNKHKKVDDTPYGGGAGMILTLQPVVDCLRSLNYQEAKVILMAPFGKPYNQKKAKELSDNKHIILICAHYEGIDDRILNYVDEVISIGDYIITGGELASMIVIDSVVRLLPDVISKESIMEESFSDGLLEYPQYTKPEEFEGYKVPEVLISGDHEKIKLYRHQTALARTFRYRKDLLVKASLSKQDLEYLEELED